MSINIPLKVNNKLLLDRLDSDFNPKIGVKYCVVNKKNIIDYGISRPLGINSNKESIHAEIKALYNIKNKKNKDIYIWRTTTSGDIKTVFCCRECTIILNKYNFKNVYTFKDNKIINAIKENPRTSLAYINYN